ncbi:hypothetical protein fHeYen801_044 [Yersinia phage fHe-Yen8-01]|nr:hypothetical protein fHeYen801_044 [Yersinia phage fHe-Yen8-01]
MSDQYEEQPDQLESEAQKHIWVSLSRAGAVMFRLNVGRAWLSNLGPRGVKKTVKGVLIAAARSIALGFSDVSGKSIEGSLDLQGYTVVEITPEMVGRKVAIYTCVDAKRTKGGKRREKQIETVSRVRAAGGIAGFASTPTEAVSLIVDWKAGK